MKTWDDWSDFEINKTLFPFTKYFGKCKDIMQKKNTNRSAVMWGDGANWFEFDGCKSWEDMGPIISDNEISLIRDVSTTPVVWEAVGKAWFTHLGIESSLGRSFEAVNPNPLRAAAIVFLMMNGVNPE